MTFVGFFPRDKFRRLTMAPVSTLPALGFVDRMQRLGLDFEKEVDGRGWAAFLKGGFNKEVEILLSF